MKQIKVPTLVTAALIIMLSCVIFMAPTFPVFAESDGALEEFEKLNELAEPDELTEQNATPQMPVIMSSTPVVDNFPDLQDAIINGDSEIIIISANLTLESTLTIRRELTITAQNSDTKLEVASGQRHFVVNGSGSLTLANITLEGSNAGGGVSVEGGSLHMQADAVIQNCKVYSGVAFVPATGGGVAVKSGQFTMDEGAAIENCKAEATTTTEMQSNIAYGGGVYVGNGAIATMNGGSISGNTVERLKGSAYGGGVYVENGSLFIVHNGEISGNLVYSGTGSNGFGGGVCVGANGTFTIKGGAIVNNSVTSANKYGSGIYVYQGQLNINGGAISGNTGTYGIYLEKARAHMQSGTITGHAYVGLFMVEASSFIMEGGEISGNSGGIHAFSRTEADFSTIEMSGGIISNNYGTTCGGIRLDSRSNLTMSAGIISGNTASAGGGVYVGPNSKFTMTNGEISGNASTADQTYGGGGGVFINNNSTFHMSGGIISGNASPNNGGGVAVRNGNAAFFMSGGEISGNGAQMTINGINCKQTNLGGGIYIDSNPTNKLEISGGAIIDGNTATSGGGLYANYYINISINDAVQITNNKAGAGGGIYANNNTVNINNSVNISANKSTGHGGGIYASNSNIAITNGVNIRDNNATNYGGGIYTSKYTSLATDNTTTFKGNTASGRYDLGKDNEEYPAIKWADVSIEGTHALNNYDINYIGGNTITVADVNYYANGGAGGPHKATVRTGATHVLLQPDAADISPASPEYRFARWNTDAEGTGMDFQPGESIIVNSNTALYAIWVHEEPQMPNDDTVTIIYYANGGEGGRIVDNIPMYSTHTVLTAEEAGVSREDYDFLRWDTVEDGTGEPFAAQSNVFAIGDMLLYAIWVPANTEPGPTDPGPTDPGPTDPGPTDPGPTDPGPTEPGPTDPGPTDPGPTDPGPTDPGPTDPGPTDPGPTDPGPTDPGPTDPKPSEPSEPSEPSGPSGPTTPVEPTPETPTTPVKPLPEEPLEPTPPPTTPAITPPGDYEGENGQTLIPLDDSGLTYEVIDANGTPLGKWTWDEGLQEWIYDEYPPLSNLPQTGSTFLPLSLIMGVLGLVVILAGLGLRIGGAKGK